MSNNGVHAFKQAFISRLVFTLLSAISNLLIPDHIPDAFLYKFSPKLPGDYFIQGFLGGLLRWDGHHYLSISQEGYTTESKFAFFPFYPFLMSFIGEIPLWCTAWFISQPYREILAGWIISTFFASASCAILYRLFVRLTSSQIVAYDATIAFIINPATVFFCACYTESIYFCFFISAVYCLCLEKPSTWLATLFLFLASSIRSNGFINIGFILHFTMHETLSETYKKASLFKVALILIRGCIQSALIAFPFIIFQIFGWYRYCYNQELCEISEATDCGEIPHEWCSDSVIYQYIQVHFWDNGFLNYWQFKKLPLFALATPTVILCYSSLKKTVLDLTPRVIFADFIGLESAKAGKPWVGPPMQICCAVHLAFLTIFSLFFMNVEVITRLVWSSSPLVYIYSAQILQTKDNIKRNNLLGYFFLYSTIGVILHSNFYPWT